MSLVSEETLNAGYWAHTCSAKEESLTYTPKDIKCFACNKTKAEATADGEAFTPQG